MKTNAAKIGAALYVLWGLMHFRAAYGVLQLANGMPSDMATQAARITQDAWHLAIIAAFTIIIAVKWNWHNDRLGYWLNLWLVSATDIGFVFLVMLPLTPLADIGPRLMGPAVWLLAVLFSTIGYRPASGSSASDDIAEDTAEA